MSLITRFSLFTLIASYLATKGRLSKLDKTKIAKYLQAAHSTLKGNPKARVNYT